MLGVKKSLGDVGAQIVTQAMNTLHDNRKLLAHWDQFYFTRRFPVTSEPLASGLRTNSISTVLKRNERLRGIGARGCDLTKVSVESFSSHVLLSSKKSEVHPHCMVFMATVAISRGDVSYALGHHGYTSLANSTSVPFNTPGMEATDQNAWIQSGNSFNKTFSDMGIDGKGYVIAYADSGADDLSCYLIDDSRHHTTRTPRNRAATPINELFRRKVVQYVAYADGWPSKDYDHGTWCSSATAGKCIFEDKKHNEAASFDGLLPHGKVCTMPSV